MLLHSSAFLLPILCVLTTNAAVERINPQNANDQTHGQIFFSKGWKSQGNSMILSNPTAGETFHYSFKGSGIRVYGESNGANASYTLDGQPGQDSKIGSLINTQGTGDHQIIAEFNDGSGNFRLDYLEVVYDPASEGGIQPEQLAPNSRQIPSSALSWGQGESYCDGTITGLEPFALGILQPVVTCRFYGDGLWLFANFGPQTGKLIVSIDGETESPMNTTSSYLLYDKIVWSRQLKKGDHELRLWGPDTSTATISFMKFTPACSKNDFVCKKPLVFGLSLGFGILGIIIIALAFYFIPCSRKQRSVYRRVRHVNATSRASLNGERRQTKLISPRASRLWNEDQNPVAELQPLATNIPDQAVDVASSDGAGSRQSRRLSRLTNSTVGGPRSRAPDAFTLGSSSSTTSSRQAHVPTQPLYPPALGPFVPPSRNLPEVPALPNTHGVSSVESHSVYGGMSTAPPPSYASPSNFSYGYSASPGSQSGSRV